MHPNLHGSGVNIGIKLIDRFRTLLPARPFVKIIIVVFFLGITFFINAPSAHAEGSADLFPNNTTCQANSLGGGCRANMEWRTDSYANGTITRRTLLRVYVRNGETLQLGSSAVGIGSGNILVFNNASISGQKGRETISGTPVLNCVTQQPGNGLISTRAQELAGPGGPTGYTPCTISGLATGIYAVVMYGPAGATGANPVGPTGTITPINATTTQNNSIDAWDVTVRDASNTIRDGRLFSYAFSLFTALNGRPVFSTFYTVTLDGYIYQTAMNGLDPNGFLIYGNNYGFLDSDGVSPLYHNVVGTDNILTNIIGGLSTATPSFPIFVNNPDPETLDALSIPRNTVAPILTNFSFDGSGGPSTSLFNTGGAFRHAVTKSCAKEKGRGELKR
jgi:hypothetical protein